MTKPKILVTGGTGYIGTHTCVALLQAGFDVIAVDNLCNSTTVALDRVKQIANRDFTFYKVDLRDTAALRAVFQQEKPDAVIHFAGFKAVGESVVQPLACFDNNLIGTLSLLKVMQDAQVYTLIFSSSAAVYGVPTVLPIKETTPLSAVNPYGRSKLILEEILQDVAAAEPAWKIACLRYFNAVGSHASGLIGEDPCGTPHNLMPCIAQVAVGKLPKLTIFGDDYPTPDGTCIRDYIHVMDLAEGHIAALQTLQQWKQTKPLIVNLGTGRGYSVLEMMRTFEQVSGQTIAYEITARRAGDVAAVWSDSTLASQLLGWHARCDIKKMCEDTWRWQQMNPQGYSK